MAHRPRQPRSVHDVQSPQIRWGGAITGMPFCRPRRRPIQELHAPYPNRFFITSIFQEVVGICGVCVVDIEDASDSTAEFWLSNGQHDVYPVSYCYPVEVIEKALEYFKATGSPPTFVNWHNDSGDGKDIVPRKPRHGERSGSAG